MRTSNNKRAYETQVAIEIACDSLAYLTIVAATMSVGSPGAQYTSAWLHLNDFIARAERSLTRINPSLPIELRAKIQQNATLLQRAMGKKEKAS